MTCGVVDLRGGPDGGATGAAGASGIGGGVMPKLSDEIGAAETGRTKLFCGRRNGGSYAVEATRCGGVGFFDEALRGPAPERPGFPSPPRFWLDDDGSGYGSHAGGAGA